MMTDSSFSFGVEPSRDKSQARGGYRNTIFDIGDDLSSPIVHECTSVSNFCIV